MAKRQAYAAIWRPYYQKYPDLATANLAEALAEGSEELQAAIIKIMAADKQADSLPPVLAQIIANQSANAEIKRLIVRSFPEAFEDEAWQERLRVVMADKEMALEERFYAIELLASFPDKTNLIALKSLILANVPEAILTAASRALAAWPDAEIDWSESEADILSALISEAETGAARWRRLWLLISLIEKYPEKIRALLSALASNSRLDAISRGLAGEALRLHFKINIETPSPSAREWQEFYEAL